MPLVILDGFPSGIAMEDLVSMRREIVATISTKLSVERGTIRIFVHEDFMPPVLSEKDGGSTVYGQFHTGRFHNRTDQFVVQLLKALTEIVWNTLEGRYEVEFFPNDLNPTRTYLKKADTPAFNDIIIPVEDQSLTDHNH